MSLTEQGVGRKQPRRFALALLGLLLIPASPVFWALTLDHTLLRQSGLAMWIAMTAGLALAGYAAWGDSRRRTRVTSALTAGWVAFSVPAFFVFTRLPAAEEARDLRRALRMTLPDHEGQPMVVGDLLGEQAVLLHFYRGYW